jgi:predicted nucleic acid-binding protein
VQEVLADTSALIAFFVQSERHHAAARQYLLDQRDTRWIILQSVFGETVTWFRTKVSIQASIAVGRVLREEHRYITLTQADDSETWDAFRRYDDKLWSYVDCSILVMARRLGVPHVYTFDEHIRQMAGLGIICVPTQESIED